MRLTLPGVVRAMSMVWKVSCYHWPLPSTRRSRPSFTGASLLSLSLTSSPVATLLTLPCMLVATSILQGLPPSVLGDEGAQEETRVFLDIKKDIRYSLHASPCGPELFTFLITVLHSNART